MARISASSTRLDMVPVTWHDHEMRLERQPAGYTVLQQSLRSGLCGLAALLFAVTVTATAQTNGPGRTVWDGVYTEAQATRGMMAFGQSCARCHALAAEGKSSLVGDGFWKSFAQKCVGDLLEYVSTSMPNGAPGSLGESAYNDVVAFLLKSNGFPAGAVELARNATAEARIIPKDGSTELPANALVRVVGCLARSGSDWVVTNATAPERAELVPGTGEEDATRPLGSRAIALKFVLTRLDGLAGSRVGVNGLLIGAGGADGINVTAVNRVAPKCP